MKSIRFRVIGTYLIIIIMTITLFEVGVYSMIKNYYISNIEVILNSAQDVCHDLYHELYYQYDLYLESEKIGNKFLPYTEAQVQILDIEGKTLYDSIGLYDRGQIALERELNEIFDSNSVSRHETTKLGERILSVSRTIISENEPVGILKLSSSLENTYDALNQLMLILIAGGLLVIIIVSIVGLLLSNTITKPIKKLANHVDSIASGNLELRTEKTYNDEFGKLTDNLNSLARELKSNRLLREQFIASVSHELRTPLTSIKGWIVTLKTRREDDDAMLNEGLDIIDEETNRLTGLVNDLLDFSSFSINRQSIKKSKFNLVELIKYTYRQMKPRADRLGIEMSYSSTEDEFLFNGDYSRLKQVLINLIDNALKYSESGDKINILSEVNKNKIRISVSDTGSGIAQSDQKDIFKKHFQGSNAKEGSGLGLALSREIIDLHGGDIMIDSTINIGTSVIIELKAR